jgi:hypothetical protein
MDTSFGTKPHEPLAILEHAKHGALRKPLFQGDALKPEVLARRELCHGRARLRHSAWQRRRWSGHGFRAMSLFYHIPSRLATGSLTSNSSL